jgi:ketosteroid isomerase-like protein
VTPEDLDTVRQAYDAFARGDAAALRRFIAPDIEWRTTPNVPFLGTYHGVDDFFHGMSEWTDSFDEITTEVKEVVDAGERAVVHHRMHGRGRDSGVDVNLAIWQVVSVRDGQLAQMHDYATRDEALSAAGG